MTSKDIHSDSANSCYTDYALQEYALNRLSPPVRSKVKTHLSDCRPCTAVLQDTEREMAYFQHLASVGTNSDNTDCPGEDDFAAYIDQRDTPEQRESLETHLGKCGSCLHGFLTLYRDIRDATSAPLATASTDTHEQTEMTESVILTLPSPRKQDTVAKLPIFALNKTGTAE
jgi:anti-sigma factor RsiW